MTAARSHPIQIIFCPFKQIPLLVVMRNEGDLFFVFRYDFF